MTIVTRILDPIQDASALLDARNVNPYPSTADLKRIERYLAKALCLTRDEIRRRKAQKRGVMLRTKYPRGYAGFLRATTNVEWENRCGR